jgi:putative transposase
MAKPQRLPSVRPLQTFFVTSSTWQKRALFQADKLAQLFLQTLFWYRDQNKFGVHAFVVMPDHFHLLITPAVGNTLERGLQYIKGGFSHRAKIAARFSGEIWQRGFTDRRVRNRNEFLQFVDYIHENPVEGNLVVKAQDYPYSSLNPVFKLDVPPPYLSG